MYKICYIHKAFFAFNIIDFWTHPVFNQLPANLDNWYYIVSSWYQLDYNKIGYSLIL